MVGGRRCVRLLLDGVPAQPRRVPVERRHTVGKPLLRLSDACKRGDALASGKDEHVLLRIIAFSRRNATPRDFRRLFLAMLVMCAAVPAASGVV